MAIVAVVSMDPHVANRTMLVTTAQCRWEIFTLAKRITAYMSWRTGRHVTVSVRYEETDVGVVGFRAMVFHDIPHRLSEEEINDVSTIREPDDFATFIDFAKKQGFCSQHTETITMESQP